MTSAPSAAHPWRRHWKARNSNPIDYYYPTLYSLAELIEGAGLPPSLRELQEAARLSSLSVVTYHLARLTVEGLVATVPNVARALSITPKGWRLLDRPMPGAPSKSLEGAVGEAVADLRSELSSKYISPTGVFLIAARLEVALDLARDSHE